MTSGDSTADPAAFLGDLTRRARAYVPGPVRRRLSLKIGVLVALVMVVVSLSGAAIYVQTTDAVRDSGQDRFTSTTRVQADSVAEWNSRMRDQTGILAASQQAQRDNARQIEPFIADRQMTLPEYVAAIHVVDTDTGEILATTTRARGSNLADGGAPWAEGGLNSTEGKTIQTDPYEDPVTGRTAIAYLAGVQDMPERTVVLVVDAQARSDALPRAAEGSNTVVVNSQGTVVLSHDSDDIGTQNVGGEGVDSPAVEAALDGEVGYTEVEMHGTTVSMGYAPVAGTDWVAMIHTPRSEAFATTGLILTSVAGMVLVTVLSLGVVALVIGRGTAADIGALADTARRLRDGDLRADIQTGREDEIGELYRSFDAMREALADRIAEAEQARQSAEQAREESEQLNRHLEEQAASYSDVMRAVAAGDLTRRMDPESRNEAMAEIAHEFNAMVGDLEAVIREVSSFADAVAASSEEVTASSEEVEASAQEVADSVQAISDGAERQDRQLQSVAEEMSSLSTTIEEIASSADQVAGVAQETAETGEAGRAAAERAIDEMETVEQEADDTVEAMTALREQMAEIEEITEFITDVAEQTNILALNANIEAARAGEAGEGFAVVADEVKDLAEETREAAERIDALVADVQAQTDVTADAVRTTSEVVAESTDIVQEAADSLAEIARYAEETNTGIQEISEATSEQATSTNQAVGMVEEAADIAEQTAEEASTVAGATEEQTAALSQMTDSAGDLAGEADQLRQTLGRFETEEAPARADEAAPDAGETADEEDADTIEAVPVDEDGGNGVETGDVTLEDAFEG